jgi:hypothetical protein
MGTFLIFFQKNSRRNLYYLLLYCPESVNFESKKLAFPLIAQDDQKAVARKNEEKMPTCHFPNRFFLSFCKFFEFIAYLT